MSTSRNGEVAISSTSAWPVILPFDLHMGCSLRYSADMTDLMKQVVDALAHVPAERQDDLARYILELGRDPHGPYPISPEERAAIEEGEGQLARGERVPEETMPALW